MLQPGTERKTAGAVAPRGDLKVFRPENPYIALGLAVNHLMTKPAFANLRFGDWSRILTGQINRKHYYFAVDSKNQIQGFMGWAVTSKEKAEAWVEGRGGLSFEDSLKRHSRERSDRMLPAEPAAAQIYDDASLRASTYPRT